TAGTPYYIEGLLKEGIGGDGLNFGVAEPTNTIAFNLLGNIPGAYLATYADPTGVSLIFTNPPVGTNILEAQTATLQVGATALPLNYNSGIRYQWQGYDINLLDFTNIVGAVGSSFTTPPLPPQVGDYQFRVVVTVPTLTKISDPVT